MFLLLFFFQDFQIWVEEPGIVRVPKTEKLSTGKLYHLGEEIPVHWDEDYFFFIAPELRGELGYYHEFAPYNIFHFVGGPKGEMLEVIKPKETSESPQLVIPYRLEEDRMMMRFGRDRNPHEIWYWQKLSCLDDKPFPFQVPQALLSSNGQTTMEIGIRGWSYLQNPIKQKLNILDHALELWAGEQKLHEWTWDGGDHQILKVKLSPEVLSLGTFQLKVPQRQDDEQKMLADLSVLNWIACDLQVQNLPQQGKVILNSGVIASTSDQIIAQGQSIAWIPAGSYSIDLQGEVWVTTPQQWNEPVAIRPIKTGMAKRETGPIDYIFITHHSLKDAIEPLAQFHQAQGLRTAIFDIENIYIDYNHGILHPKAIRDFLADRYFRHEQKPLYVLLVGDASWDTKNSQVDNELYPPKHLPQPNSTRMGGIPSTPYGSNLNDRNLVPTWMYFDSTGHSASDNWFVCVEGDDFHPEMALGRLPFVQPEEVRDYVEKVKTYTISDQQNEDFLFITNEYPHFQRNTDTLVKERAEEGFGAARIYPAKEDKDNVTHTQTIIDQLNRQPYIVSFNGHGGRYIWRTGPPDYKKNHDLFTLDDIDKLEPSEKPPVILSFTCFSAPFDHPGSDSIGEKFVRVSQKGAIAFIGASWRNSPGYRMQRAFLETFSESNTTVGKAMLKAKRNLNNPSWVETYNLLGDPAVKINVNAADMKLSIKNNLLEITSEHQLQAKVQVLLLNELGQKLKQISLDCRGGEIGEPGEEARYLIVRAKTMNGANVRGFLKLGSPDSIQAEGSR